MSYTVPILVIAFNRPGPSSGLLEILRLLQPVRLYLAFDGPRKAHPGDREKCEAVRQLFRDGIDWPCEAFWLLRNENLGCRLGVSTAIDWFFESESEGIILEDDIHPIPSFFGYCAELLERYRDDQRIGMIAANNHQSERPRDGASYYFSIFSHCWGWATWRRAWSAYHHAEALWPQFREQRLLHQLGGPAFERRWRFLIDQVFDGHVNTWDIPWQLACWQRGYLTCLPATELIHNVGFDHDATHTMDEQSPLQSPQPLSLPLQHPAFIQRCQSFDYLTFERLYRRRFRKEFKSKILKVMRLLGCR